MAKWLIDCAGKTMRFFLITSGSFGDVHPFLGLGRALGLRGHEVTVLTHPHFAAAVSAAGLESRPIASSVDVPAILRQVAQSSPLRAGAIGLRATFNAAPEAIREITRIAVRNPPDCIVSHHLCFGSSWIAQQLGIPHARVVLSPVFWFSKLDGVNLVQRGSGWLETWLARRLIAPAMTAMRIWGTRQLKRTRKASGMPPGRVEFLEEFRGGDLNLGLWSSGLRPPQSDDPAAGRICGFSWFEPDTSLPPALRHFLADGPAPVVFTLGTVLVKQPRQFFEIARVVCRRLGMRGVLVTGKESIASTDDGNDLLTIDYAPFSQLFERAGAVVCHGGMGTLAQALRAGRPVVVVPHNNDQFANALYAESAGVAARINAGRLNANRLEATLRQVIGDQSMGQLRSKLRQQLSGECGSETAARELENML